MTELDPKELDLGEDRPKKPKPEAKFKTAVPAQRRIAADMSELVQRARIAASNAIGGMTRDYKKAYTTGEADGQAWVEPLEALEKQFFGYMEGLVKKDPVAKWLKNNVKGMGWRLAAKIMAQIGDISLFDKVSNLWSYAGMRPDSRRKVGEKSNHNPMLKKILYVFSDCFIKAGGFYRQAYDHFKKVEEGKAERLILWVKEQLEALDDNVTAQEVLGRLNDEHEKALQARAAKKIFKYGKFQKALYDAARVLGFEAKKKSSAEKPFYVVGRAYKFLSVLKSCGEVVNDIAVLEAPFKIRRDRPVSSDGDDAIVLEPVLGVPAMTPQHRDLRARRKVEKLFLEHLWVTWRKLKKLPVAPPWVFSVGGHDIKHYTPPPEGSDSVFEVLSGRQAEEEYERRAAG